MQHNLMELVHAEDVLIGLDGADSFSTIRALNDLLVRSGKTLAEYGEDAAERERTFPTGLPTEPIAVAIPHAAATNVLGSAIAIATLRRPVVFAQMGTDGSITLEVELVFLLAVKEQEKQVEMIAQLMRVIQNASVLTGMAQAQDPAQVLELVRQSIVS